jgi:hypothetical protein
MIETKTTTLKDRLFALLDTLLDDNESIPGPYRPVIRNLVKGYLNKAKPEEMHDLIVKMRDEVIPFLLEGDVPEQ